MVYQSFATKNGRFRIDIVGFVEPNNGRELSAVDIFHDDKAITHRVLPKKWPFINFRTERWSLEDAAGRFIYVSAESRAKLIHTESLDVFTLTYQGLSTATFVGNSFAFGRLVEVYRDCVVVTDLETLISAEFPQPKDTYIEWAELKSASSLSIQPYRWENRKRIELPTIIIDLR